MCRLCAVANRIKTLNQQNSSLLNTRSLSTLIEIKQLARDQANLAESSEERKDLPV